MALSTDLWQTNHDLALDILNQSFVQGLADGRLSRQCFAYYVGQDVFFLKAFARAYSIAGAKAPDWDGFCSLHALAGGVLEELQLHEKYAAEWGVDVIDVEPGVATRRYTDFLLATAWAYETGTALTAMSPCMRLYAYLGQQLEQLSPPDISISTGFELTAAGISGNWHTSWNNWRTDTLPTPPWFAPPTGTPWNASGIFSRRPMTVLTRILPEM